MHCSSKIVTTPRDLTDGHLAIAKAKRVETPSAKWNRRFRLGGVGGAASLHPRPPWLKSRAGTEPERSGGGVRLMLN